MGWSGENQHSDGIPIPPALDEEWKERDPDDHRCYPEDVGSWDDFPGQVRTYLLRPVPWLLCENRPANKVVDGVVVPDVYTDYYGFGVEFGMEEYKLLTVTSVSRFLRLKQSLPWHSGPPLQAGDVLLEVNGEPLCGGGTGVPYTVMKVLWWKNMTLSITVVSPQHLNNDLDVSHYLNDAMFPKHSLKWAIQRCLRVTIYCLSVPVTNRPRRSDDLDRLDGGYLFVTNEELYRWLGRQYFVEGGEYEGWLSDEFRRNTVIQSRHISSSAMVFVHLLVSSNPVRCRTIQENFVKDLF